MHRHVVRVFHSRGSTVATRVAQPEGLRLVRRACGWWRGPAGKDRGMPVRKDARDQPHAGCAAVVNPG